MDRLCVVIVHTIRKMFHIKQLPFSLSSIAESIFPFAYLKHIYLFLFLLVRLFLLYFSSSYSSSFSFICYFYVYFLCSPFCQIVLYVYTHTRTLKCIGFCLIHNALLHFHISKLPDYMGLGLAQILISPLYFDTRLFQRN